MPDGEDPDSYLRKHGGGPFSSLLEKAQTVIDFLFSIAKGRRTDAVREALTVVAEVKDTLEAEQMLVELSGRTRIQETVLRAGFQKVKGRKSGAQAMPAARRLVAAGNAEELLLLSAVIAFPGKANEVLARIDLNAMKDPAALALFQRLAGASDRGNLASVFEGAGVEERLLFTRLSVDPKIQGMIARFANSFDVKEWNGLEACFTESLYTDYSDLRGTPPQTITASEYVRLRRESLDHLKLHHLVSNYEVDFIDSNAATCRASMVVWRKSDEEEFTYTVRL